MKIPSLLYHDVVPGSRFEESGFPGADADVYKLTVDQFQGHLQAIRGRTSARAVSVLEAIKSGAKGSDFALTFDDGGISALTRIEPMLREYGWCGHFFITTDWIGRPGFLTQADVRELFSRGQVIGTHSCSHPPIISACNRAQLHREWSDSTKILSDIIGAPVTTGSIPGGFFSKAVAETAAEAGVRVLFTSEPVLSMREAHGCLLVGRYSIQRGTPARDAAALAAAETPAILKQALLWNAKKPFKALGGRYWISFRKAVFASLNR